MARSTALAYIAMATLGVSAIVILFGFFAEDSYHHLAQQALAGQYVSLPRARAQAAEHRIHSIGWLEIGLYVVTGISFLAWFRNAYTNVGRLGVKGLRWSAGWSIGAWFVPILNLVRPKAILNDIWRGSEPQLPAGASISQQSPPILYALWWGVLILGGVVARLAAFNFGSARSLSALSSATQQMMYADFISVTAALLAVGVVHSLSSRQRQRAKVLNRSSGSPAISRACRCTDLSELRGNEALGYLDHLKYISEDAGGWLFRCPELHVEWTAPVLAEGAPPETFELRRQSGR